MTSMAAFIVPGDAFSPDPDPLHTRLLEKHGVQVPVLGWPPHNRRYLRSVLIFTIVLTSMRDLLRL